MTFTDAFPSLVTAGSSFATAVANLERTIPASQADVDHLVAELQVRPGDDVARAELNVAAQKLARRHKAAADLVALYLHQRMGTHAAPDPGTTCELMTYHDGAIRDAFAAKCIAIRSVYDPVNAETRMAHLADTYRQRLFLGGELEAPDKETAIACPLGTGTGPSAQTAAPIAVPLA